MLKFQNPEKALKNIIEASKSIYGIDISPTAVPKQATITVKRRHRYFSANRRYQVILVEIPDDEEKRFSVCDCFNGNVEIFKNSELASITIW